MPLDKDIPSPRTNIDKGGNFFTQWMLFFGEKARGLMHEFTLCKDTREIRRDDLPPCVEERIAPHVRNMKQENVRYELTMDDVPGLNHYIITILNDWSHEKREIHVKTIGTEDEEIMEVKQITNSSEITHSSAREFIEQSGVDINGMIVSELESICRYNRYPVKILPVNLPCVVRSRTEQLIHEKWGGKERQLLEGTATLASPIVVRQRGKTDFLPPFDCDRVHFRVNLRSKAIELSFLKGDPAETAPTETAITGRALPAINVEALREAS